LLPWVTAAGLLGGCSAYETVSDLVTDPVVLACPAHLVVADAVEMTRFRDGPGRDLTDVDFDGKIVDARLGCTSNVDKKTREGVQEVEIVLTVEARRGPANRDRKARFPYFIRVVDAKQRILWGENLTVSVDFPGNNTQVRFRSKPVTLELPINRRWSNRSYTFFLGFDLSRDELEFNRRRRAQQRR